MLLGGAFLFGGRLVGVSFICETNLLYTMMSDDIYHTYIYALCQCVLSLVFLILNDNACSFSFLNFAICLVGSPLLVC